MAERRRPWEDDDEISEDKVNFLKELVLSRPSGMGLLAALTFGAIASIPLGLGVGALPILLYAAGQSIAALFVPSSPVFREWVLKGKRKEQREQAREHLVGELRARMDQSVHWDTYRQMCDRVTSLKALARNKDTGLTERDVERLDDATVDYLGIWLAWHLMYERFQSTDERSLRGKIRQIEQRLEGSELGPVERKQLEKAKGDLSGILERRGALAARATALEAELLAMADRFEEVYQRVVANPRGDVSRELSDAVERMQVEEALDMAVDTELDAIFRRRKARAAERA
ncbi:MAG: hypothetical protein R3F59_24890 [Myxococcota bacterium]